MNNSQDPKAGRGVLLSMGIAYALGTFNDNFFKYAAILLAADAGLTHIQGRATVLFALTFGSGLEDELGRLLFYDPSGQVVVSLLGV